MEAVQNFLSDLVNILLLVAMQGDGRIASGLFNLLTDTWIDANMCRDWFKIFAG